MHAEGASPASESWDKDVRTDGAEKANAVQPAGKIKQLIDSGSTSHFVASPKGATIVGEAKGNVILGGNGAMKMPMTLRIYRPGLGRAVVVPGLSQELHSVSKYGEAGMDTLFTHGRVYIYRRDDHEIVRTGSQHGGLYYADDDTDRTQTIAELMGFSA